MASPKKKTWTDLDNLTLYSLRAQGAAWGVISAALGLPVSTCMDQARAIGAGRGFVRSQSTVQAWAEERQAGDDDRLPLPPGHPTTWGLLTAGTSLEGSAYVYSP